MYQSSITSAVRRTYNLSLSGLELLLGSLELFLFPLSDVLTLLGLFSLAVLSAWHYALMCEKNWRYTGRN